ncbi:Calcium-transporting ATPase 2 [Grifola frondosa]|uniref:Calcium-transporting ATPase 2 n=1 Tax=Grifola frondosa TaxID=5627 RepID=A0A1C7M5H9_GRIFR|nr:Calcium-transporting ATPase 2 [Grifola frondosa]
MSNNARSSLDVPHTLTLSPHSPTPSFTSSNDGSSTYVPPSPTLSTNSSVHFANSLALRDNKPDEKQGITSLNLLTPDYGHRRKGSFASSMEGSTEGGDSSTIASPTHTHCDATSDVDYTTVIVRSRSTPKDPDAADAERDAAKDEADNERPVLDLSQDEQIDAGPFAFKPYALASLVDPKNMEMLESMGGVKALLKGLGTSRKRGLGKKALMKANASHHGLIPHIAATDSHPGTDHPHGAGVGASQRHDRHTGDDKHAGDVPGIVVTGPGGEDGGGGHHGGHLEEEEEIEEGGAFEATLDERHRVYGENVLPTRKTKSLLQLMWLALKDKVLVLLSIAAVVSLALGFFQDFGTPRPAGEPPVDWVEGVAIMVAIAIVVMVGSLNDWQKERQFQTLNEKKEERGVKVIRDGVEKVIDIKEVVVGDVALVEPGEIVPCDGVFLSGHNVKCDESGATGESDAIKKVSYEDCERAKLAAKGEGSAGGDHMKHTDCFIISGSKVLEGYGSYVVIAVGTKSFNGRIMMALRGDTENTPLQIKLNNLAELIAKLGSAAGLILFTALMIRFFVQLGTGSPQRTSNQYGIAFVQILIISVTLIVVAVPEGLPLAVTLALAFATKRMTKENLLVRVLGSCETMANASVVCTDKTGTLTQNAMTVVAGSVGIHCKFVHNLEDNLTRTNAGEEAGVREETIRRARKHTEDFSIDQEALNDVLSPQLQQLFNEAIAINSTAFEDEDPDTGENGWADYKETRESADIIQMIPFSSERKAMGVVVRLPNGRYRIYLKGQTIALCYRDFTSWPPPGSHYAEEDEVDYDDLATDLISSASPVSKILSVKMCTGDNVLTARSIALQCGIYTAGGIIMEGPIFRQLSPSELQEVVPRLQVLARSSPEDKKLLVETLRSLGEIVGVTATVPTTVLR